MLLEGRKDWKRGLANEFDQIKGPNDDLVVVIFDQDKKHWKIGGSGFRF